MAFPQPGGGGGGGGTNIPFTTKGQLVVAGTGGSVNVFNIGTDGQALVAQSAQSLGVKWEDRLKIFTYNLAGALTVQTGVNRLPVPPGETYSIEGAYAMVNTAPTGASIIIDILKNGTTVYTGGTNRPTIAAGANASQTPVAPAITSLAGGDYLTVNIAQIGSTVAGSDLTLQLILGELT